MEPRPMSRAVATFSTRSILRWILVRSTSRKLPARSAAKTVPLFGTRLATIRGQPVCRKVSGPGPAARSTVRHVALAAMAAEIQTGALDHFQVGFAALH